MRLHSAALWCAEQSHWRLRPDGGPCSPPFRHASGPPPQLPPARLPWLQIRRYGHASTRFHCQCCLHRPSVMEMQQSDSSERDECERSQLTAASLVSLLLQQFLSTPTVPSFHPPQHGRVSHSHGSGWRVHRWRFHWLHEKPQHDFARGRCRRRRALRRCGIYDSEWRR